MALEINYKHSGGPSKQEKNVTWNFCLSGEYFVKSIRNQIDVRS